MNNNISLKKPTFFLTILVIFAVGFISGIAVTSFKASKTGVNPASANIKGMEEAILAKIKENPNNVELMVQLGHFYFDNDMYKKAINAYEKSLSLSPNQPDVMTDLAIMYRRSGDKKKALEVLNKTIASFPKHEPSRFNKGIILANDFDDIEGTVKTWEDLYKINPAFKAPDGQNLLTLINHYKENHDK